jgi:hypothetical protein
MGRIMAPGMSGWETRQAVARFVNDSAQPETHPDFQCQTTLVFPKIGMQKQLFPISGKAE